ncbi:MAG: ABC transporter substrate-binding protein [Tissierella sp.]|uniref:ABC transporter substrate-binding protein n=1 Tax=Tissierella sp. TaxID=41274 RepID=UPI003F9C5197
MKRNIIKLFILIFTLSLSIGCGNEGQNKSEISESEDSSLVMAIGSEPEEGFDPCLGWGRYGDPLFQSTLVKTDENMDIANDLATDYTVSDDGLTLKFTIRDDVYYTDGEKLKAEDIVFTFKTAKSSGSIVDLTNMEDIKKTGDLEIKFKLNKPDSSFLYTIAATGIVPEHSYDENYSENPIGSGPFVLKQWDKGQQVIMVANENYYEDIPQVGKVTILFMEEDTAFVAAKAGELDVAVTSANIAEQEIEGMDLKSLKTIDNRGLTLPYLKDEGEFDENGNKIGNDVTSDISIRRALSYGIDRKSLVGDVINGYGRPAFTECDDMPWASEDAIVEYSKEKAKSILDESGWMEKEDGIREKDGIKAEFNLLYSAGDSTRQALASAVASQAQELGIKINVEGTSWDVIDKRMFSEAVLMGWGAQSPMETYLLYHSDNMGRDYYNPEYFSSEIVDTHIDNAMSSIDRQESFKHWKKVQWDGETGVATIGESPWVWLVNVDHLYYIREGLDIGTQKIHPHGHSWPLIANLRDWKWNK